MDLLDKKIGEIAVKKFGLQEGDKEYKFFILGYKESLKNKKEFCARELAKLGRCDVNCGGCEYVK